MNKVPMTVNGMKALKEELEYLKSVARPEVIVAIKEARAHGDLSENAEYDAAKEKQAHIESKIANYESQLSKAHVINIEEIDDDGRVVFGATVSIINLETENHHRYQIVGEYEADIKQNKLSISSPLARAMVGKVVGDIAEVQTPEGIKDYEILKIEYIGS